MNRPPNVLLIIADDLGCGDVACFGHSQQQTPAIDALAASGVRCRQFQAAGPVCSPSRAAMFTGRYPQRCGIEGVVSAGGHRHTGLPRDERTLMQELHDAGYRTGLFGKWHLGYAPYYNPVHFGCDEFRGYVSGNVDYRSHVDQAGFPDWWAGDRLAAEEGYVTDLITGAADDFLRRQTKGSAPFCCIVAHEAPHYPYQGRSDRADRVAGTVSDRAHGSRSDQATAYGEMIAALDEGIGRLLQTLEERELRDDTLVILTADHGACGPGSNAPWRAGKGTLYQGGLLVPTIWSWPGRLPVGADDTQPRIHMDIHAGILAAAGRSAVSATDGVDPLVDLGRGDGDAPPRQLAWRFGQWAAIRRGDRKAVHDPASGWSLYDLRVDPGETDPQPMATDLLQAWRGWEAEVTRERPQRA